MEQLVHAYLLFTIRRPQLNAWPVPILIVFIVQQGYAPPACKDFYKWEWFRFVRPVARTAEYVLQIDVYSVMTATCLWV